MDELLEGGSHCGKSQWLGTARVAVCRLWICESTELSCIVLGDTDLKWKLEFELMGLNLAIILPGSFAGTFTGRIYMS